VVRRHRLPGQPAGRPRGLKIKSTGDAVNVQQLAREKQSRNDLALHRLEIHLAQSHAAAGHEFVLVQALARHREFRADQLLDEPVLRGPRERGPARVARDAGGQDELFPKA
jgi:hypothetical protein